ncbi:sterol desaturase family protein [Chitinophaga defluvii]|uniref:Sterol desaturase family protein n=1 Tax=Chitinophaga defluvii TaxID=3163343 RepID=A0ABV2SYN4_9BACT
MKKYFVSNSTDSVRMFKSDLLESFSKVSFYVPLLVYIPLIIFLSWKALFDIKVGGWVFLEFLLAGLLIWTLSEYVLHRFVFHFVPKAKWALRIHFIFHGVHHDYPRDAKRLVMPPSASIPMALILYFFFDALLPENMIYAFFTGFIIGYLVYDMVHYALHHANFKSRFWKNLKKHHMLHHYSEPTKGYGVSSPLWDLIFRSDFDKKQPAAEKQETVDVAQTV